MKSLMVFCLNGFSWLLFSYLSSRDHFAEIADGGSAYDPMNRCRGMSVKGSMFTRPTLMFLQDRNFAMISLIRGASTVVRVRL